MAKNKYEQSFLSKHRNMIIAVTVFMIIFSAKSWLDFDQKRPVVIYQLIENVDRGKYIDPDNVEDIVKIKANLPEDVITQKNELAGMYTTMDIASKLPVRKIQVCTEEQKYGYMAGMEKNVRVIPLPSDVNSSGFDVDEFIEITLLKTIEDEVISDPIKVYGFIKEKRNSKGIGFSNDDDTKIDSYGNVPSVLMVEILDNDAIRLQKITSIRKGHLAISKVPPSMMNEILSDRKAYSAPENYVDFAPVVEEDIEQLNEDDSRVDLELIKSKLINVGDSNE